MSFNLKDWLAEGGNKRLRKYSLSYSYSTIGWVFTPVRVLADTISGVPLNFYDESGDLITIDTHEQHPLYKVLFPPKRYEHSSMRDLIKTSIILQSIGGDVFWHKEKGKRSKKIENLVAKKSGDITAVTSDPNDTDSDLIGWIEKDNKGQIKESYRLQTRQ